MLLPLSDLPVAFYQAEYRHVSAKFIMDENILITNCMPVPQTLKQNLWMFSELISYFLLIPKHSNLENVGELNIFFF